MLSLESSEASRNKVRFIITKDIRIINFVNKLISFEQFTAMRQF